jgi:hypothetical protein
MAVRAIKNKATNIDSEFSLSSIMVVGVNTRPIVKSAKALGLKTVAVDCFEDADLLTLTDALFSTRYLERGEPPEETASNFLELSLKALEVHDVDAILLTSGTEHDPKFAEELGKVAEIIGNERAQMQTCENKEKLFRVADRLGIPIPPTKRVNNLNDALNAAEDIGYPIVLKPAFGAGGRGIRFVRSPEELERFYEEPLSAGDNTTLYVQKYVRGVDASTSVLSNGDEARCLTVNEQIIGDERLGAPEPFGYCGNVVPLSKQKFADKIAEYSEAICAEIRLVGSNGVDFVLSDKPYLMEVNPRFQNTIDCIEGLLKINLVEEHIRACRGEVGKYKQARGCSVKLILYAKENSKIPDLKEIPNIVDIPIAGGTITKGKPICSVLKFGRERRGVIADAYDVTSKVYKKIFQCM